MNTITKEIGPIWNERLLRCLKENGYTQESFAKAYKKKYGTGNQTDVSRWLRVGSVTQNKGNCIGMPSYDTMKQIADFFGVTVGYLTGETDYQSFEMEKACNYLGLTESAGKTIKQITKGTGMPRLYRYLSKETRAAMCYLLEADQFTAFIDAILYLAESLYKQKNPVNYMERACSELNPELVEKALFYMHDYDVDDSEVGTEFDPELLQAIDLLNKAEDKDYAQPFTLERELKIAKFSLQEIYFSLIDEILCDDHLHDLTARQLFEVSSTKELKALLDQALGNE